MNLFSAFLDSIYPRCCPVCHDVVTPRGELICPGCLPRLQPIGQPRCMRCGKSLLADEEEYCADCSGAARSFDQGFGIYPYNELMKKSMEKYKFQGRREYGDFYIQAMLHYGGAHIARWNPDCIIPIPLTPRKKRQRGFNQAEYLAVGIGRALGIPVRTEDLRRNPGGKEQKKLDARGRWLNRKNMFLPGPSCAPHRCALLVDDVYTTGSTLDAAACVLRENGTKKVCFLTVCQGKGI